MTASPVPLRARRVPGCGEPTWCADTQPVLTGADWQQWRGSHGLSFGLVWALGAALLSTAARFVAGDARVGSLQPPPALTPWGPPRASVPESLSALLQWRPAAACCG